MKQIKTITKLKEVFPIISSIKAAVLYGSFGRNEANPNSDIDIQLLVDEEFDLENFMKACYTRFSATIKSIRHIELRNKVVIYFNEHPKVEFAICNNLEDLDKNYLGSEITDVKQTILFERNHAETSLEIYLSEKVRAYNDLQVKASLDSEVNNLIEKFIYEFESCSTMQRRSDGYQFYFFYNIALNAAVQITHLALGHTKFNFLPKYFTSSILPKDNQKSFSELSATLYLPEANTKKRALLEFFYEAIRPVVTEERFNEIHDFCEWIFERDFLWNFRDASFYNPNMKSGLLYRTATLTFFQNTEKFDQLLQEKKIKTIIDLRAPQEIDEFPYSETSLGKFNYVHAPFDPWHQPQWFKDNHRQGTNEEIAYRFFAIGCNDEIKKIVETIINQDSGSVAIHCFAGKDRTGILVSLFHLLLEAPMDWIHADYLASEVDVQLYRLHYVLDIVEQKGGIIPYLEWCGLTNDQIIQLKTKLSK